MHEDEVVEVPRWVLPFFAERPDGALEAWWEAVRRLYGPLGVRMDFRAVTPAVGQPDEPVALAAG